MAKYDWPKLKWEFVTGDFLTISDFFKFKNITNNSRVRTRSKGWRKERLDYQREILVRAQEKVTESETQIRLRQQKVAIKLQEKAVSALDYLPVSDCESARKLLVSGMDEEREALGMNKGTVLTQIDCLAVPETELDDMVKCLNYEQVLELIAEVKKEQEGRQKVTER